MGGAAEHRVDPAVERAAVFIQDLGKLKTDQPQVAEPMERLVARLMDLVLWFAIAMVCSAAGYYFQVWFMDNPGVRVGTTGLGDNAPEFDPLVAWVTFAVALAAVVALEVLPTARWGRTWAKRRLGLRVVGPDGGPPGFRRAAVRFAAWYLPSTVMLLSWAATFGTGRGLFAMVGLFATLAIPGWVFRSDRHRGLHDVLAGTRVLTDR